MFGVPVSLRIVCQFSIAPAVVYIFDWTRFIKTPLVSCFHEDEGQPGIWVSTSVTQSFGQMILTIIPTITSEVTQKTKRWITLRKTRIPASIQEYVPGKFQVLEFFHRSPDFSSTEKNEEYLGTFDWGIGYDGSLWQLRPWGQGSSWAILMGWWGLAIFAVCMTGIRTTSRPQSGWWFQRCFIITPYLGKWYEMIQFDVHNMFQMGWNHQLAMIQIGEMFIRDCMDW